MRTLTRMTNPDRVEAILQLCHGMTLYDIAQAIEAWYEAQGLRFVNSEPEDRACSG